MKKVISKGWVICQPDGFMATLNIFETKKAAVTVQKQKCKGKIVAPIEISIELPDSKKNT